MNIAELINDSRDGRNSAQKCLFDLFADKMLVVCSRYVKSREDAEEVMLDGFYKFFKTISSFSYQGEAALYNWIKRIMINECLMFLRKKNVFTIVAETNANEMPFNQDALDNLTAEEILALIHQLPVGYRTVFNLNMIEGMTHDEIGGLLGISSGTSKSQLSKARNLLQKLIAQQGIEYAKQKTK